MKAIQFRGNTPAIEAFMGEDMAAIERIKNEKSITIGLKVHTKNEELKISLNDWIIKEGDVYYILNTNAFVVFKSKQDRIDGLIEMIKEDRKECNHEIKALYDIGWRICGVCGSTWKIDGSIPA